MTTDLQHSEASRIDMFEPNLNLGIHHAIGMAQVPRKQQRVVDVIIVLSDASPALAALGPMEVFQAAGTLWNAMHGQAELPRFRVRTASVDGCAVRTSYAYPLLADCAIENVDAADIILLPGAASVWRHQPGRHARLLSWLRLWYQRGASVVGLGNGVALLAESGLLDGKEATAHWAIAPLLMQCYPSVHWRTDYAITEYARMLCGTGVDAATELSLYLVEKHGGRELALQCARALGLSIPDHLHANYAMRPLSFPHCDQAVHETEDYLRKNMHRDISTEFLAERIDMGARSFVRRFKAATGHAPGTYMQLLRIAAAKQLLENGGASIAQVSAKIGYSDQAFFRRLFRRHTGLTPSAYREQFAPLRARRVAT